MEPPAGAAPARFLYKRNPQAAARRPNENGSPSRSSKSEGWSQSPVLPWAQRAYDARLSAGSTAALAYGHFLRPRNWSPHPELHRAGFHTKEVHHSKCSGGSEIGDPDRLRSGDLLHERQACCLDYTTRTEMERVNGIAPSSRPSHGRILLLNHTRLEFWILDLRFTQLPSKCRAESAPEISSSIANHKS